MPATPIDLGTAIMEAVREIGGLLKLWVAGAEIRKMKAAIEVGERYIRVSRLLLDEVKKQNVLKKESLNVLNELEKLEDRFFKFN